MKTEKEKIMKTVYRCNDCGKTSERVYIPVSDIDLCFFCSFPNIEKIKEVE